MSALNKPTADELETIRSIMKSTRIAMLTTIDEDGGLDSHPMTVQEADFDGDCWFLASDKSAAVKQLMSRPNVNVAYSGSAQWLSLSGSAEVVRDEAKKKELWNTFTEAWFTDGETDPSVVLIHVKAQSVQYWDSPGKLATLVSMLKAKVTGTEPKAGESASVDL